ERWMFFWEDFPGGSKEELKFNSDAQEHGYNVEVIGEAKFPGGGMPIETHDFDKSVTLDQIIPVGGAHITIFHPDNPYTFLTLLKPENSKQPFRIRYVGKPPADLDGRRLDGKIDNMEGTKVKGTHKFTGKVPMGARMAGV